MSDDKNNRDERHTTDGLTPGFENQPAPGPIDPKTKQHTSYWILSDEERAKGFIRPVRTSYIHVGVRPKYPVRALEGEELAQHARWGYTHFEAYPPNAPETQGGNVTGRMWTARDLSSGCNTVTTMSLKIAETYAVNPGYYNATFCVKCGLHLPVGPSGEFVWNDGTGQKVGT